MLPRLAKVPAVVRVDKDDLFALLREFGGSIAGAVTLREPGELKAYRPDYEPLDDRTLAKRLKQALEDSDQAITDDSRSTLPGYQPKVLVARIDGHWGYPTAGHTRRTSSSLKSLQGRLGSLTSTTATYSRNASAYRATEVGFTEQAA